MLARLQVRRALKVAAPRRGVSARAASSDVTDKVRNIIAEQLARDVDTVKAESQFAELGADSLDTVEIMMAMEEAFDLELDEDQAENITTVQQAADLIAAQSKEA